MLRVGGAVETRDPASTWEALHLLGCVHRQVPLEEARGVTMARARTKHDAVVSVTNSSPRPLLQPPTVTGSDIARRAYDLYLARGCETGHDVEDWLKAEQELLGTMSSAGA